MWPVVGVGHGRHGSLQAGREVSGPCGRGGAPVPRQASFPVICPWANPAHLPGSEPTLGRDASNFFHVKAQRVEGTVTLDLSRGRDF